MNSKRQGETLSPKERFSEHSKIEEELLGEQEELPVNSSANFFPY
jgi:hypothetical protein